MKIIALIPARSGSKSVPDKNILPLGRYPLIAYSIAAAKMSKYIERVFVSTDSREYAEIAKQYGAEAPFLRPAEFSQDLSTDNETFAHFLTYLNDRGEPVPDLIVHFRPTTPLRDIKIVDQAIEYMQTHPEATSVRSMHKTHLTPYKMFRLDGEFAKPFLSDSRSEFYNLPRQMFEDTFLPNGQVDVVRPNILLEHGSFHGDNIKLWITPKVADIDVREDYDFARQLLGRKDFQPLHDYLKEHYG